jgi:hypothetical protein
MFLEKLSGWPSPKKTKLLLFFSIALFIIIYPILNYYYIISHYPVSVVQSQLSFSGSVIKSHLRTMDSEEIRLYRITQTIDYLFMISYGTLYFTLSLYVARKYDSTSDWRKSGYYVAIFGILAAICDSIENIFILLMLTDPLGFPNEWAIIHSCFALVKFGLMGIIIIWVLLASILLLIRKKSSK